MRIVIQQDPKTKKISSQKIPTGKRKANDSGVQSILSYVTAIINPQVVQGNFDTEQYQNYIYEIHVNITTNVVVNCYNWEIADEDIDNIVDFIMAVVQPFVSRLVENKERESYESSLKYGENPGTSQGQQMFFKP